MKLRIDMPQFQRLSVVGVLLLGHLVFGCLTPLSGQDHSSPTPPDRVLGAYRNLDAEGGRLTDSGWYEAATFFVRAERPLERRIVAVMYGEHVDGVTVKGNRAQGWVRCSAVGQIDSLARFTSVVAPLLLDPAGHPQEHPTTPKIIGLHALEREYDLVLTDTHWEYGPQHEFP